jgi:hypothetical protein
MVDLVIDGTCVMARLDSLRVVPTGAHARGRMLWAGGAALGEAAGAGVVGVVELEVLGEVGW